MTGAHYRWHYYHDGETSLSSGLLFFPDGYYILEYRAYRQRQAFPSVLGGVCQVLSRLSTF